jgi:hypothetical protein
MFAGKLLEGPSKHAWCHGTTTIAWLYFVFADLEETFHGIQESHPHSLKVSRIAGVDNVLGVVKKWLEYQTDALLELNHDIFGAFHHTNFVLKKLQDALVRELNTDLRQNDT